MLKLINVLLITTAIFLCCNSAYAERSLLDISAGIGLLSGDTSSQDKDITDPNFGDPIYFTRKRRLEFPLDVYMGSIAMSSAIMDKFFINADVQKNISSDAGHLRITDWGFFSFDGPEGPDTILVNGADRVSISEAELDAVIADINFRYKFFDISYDSDFGKGAWEFFIGVGYLYQNFEYDYSDLEEWYPYGHAQARGFPDRIYASGDIGTYDASYSIPYVELAFGETVGKLNVEFSVGYSAWVSAEDEHETTYPWEWNSKGDCDGTALMLSLVGRYDFSEHWFITFQYDARKIKTEGEETTHYYPFYYLSDYNAYSLEAFIDDPVVDLQIESSQNSYYITAGFGF